MSLAGFGVILDPIADKTLLVDLIPDNWIHADWFRSG